MIVIPQLQLGYQEIPKVASTTVTAWLWAHLKAAAPDIPASAEHAFARRSLRDPEAGTIVIRNTAEALSKHTPLFTFALTRDPVRRFISMFRNRVVHFRELSETSAAATALRQNGLPFDPQINDLIARWDAYSACGKSVAHHARDQMYFLGPDLGVYQRLVDVSVLPEVLTEIRARWQDLGLTQLREVTVPIRKGQAGGPPVGLEALSEASFEKLLVMYHDDYRDLPTLDRDEIVRAYQQARREHAPDGSVPVVAFGASAKPAKGKKPAAARPAATAPAAKVAAAKAAAPNAAPALPAQIAALRFKPMEALSGLQGAISLRGLLLLKADLDPADFTLLVKSGEREHACQWPLTSPNAAREFPDNRLAVRARFVSDQFVPRSDEVATLVLRGRDGTDVQVAEYRPTVAAN